MKGPRNTALSAIPGRGPLLGSLLAHTLILGAATAFLGLADGAAIRPAEFRAEIRAESPPLEAPPPPAPAVPEPPAEPVREEMEEPPEVDLAPGAPDLFEPIPDHAAPELATAMPDTPVLRERKPRPAPAALYSPEAPRPPAATPVAFRAPRGPSRPAAPAAGNPPPVYPRQAVERGLEGMVVLLVTVLADGRVADVAVAQSSGHPILDREAARAVSRWSFAPAVAEGVGIAARIEVPIRFRLR